MAGSYDTIHFWSTDQPGNYGIIENRINKESKNGLGYSGKIGSLFISVSERGTAIHGSISSYYLGNNCNELSLDDFKLAIAQLEKDLELNLMDAKITRLDFALNIFTDYPPSLYFPYLGDHPKYFRDLHHGHPYYKKGQEDCRVLAFYDKKKERKKKKLLPVEWNDLNVMRMELRFSKRIKKELGHDVYGSTLCEETFWNYLKGLALAEYESITKVKPIRLNTDRVYTEKEFTEAMATCGIEHCGGINNVDAIINEHRAKNGFSNSAVPSRVKSNMRRFHSNRTIDISDHLIDELTNKVRLCL